MRDLLFHLQRGSRTPLQTQLRELLVSAIRQGQIPVGSPLPSSRKLAETLDVARATPPRNCFRLGFSSIPVDRIEPGLQKLGDIIQSQLKEAGAAPGRPPSVVI